MTDQEALEILAKTARAAQGVSVAHEFILMEIVRDLARSTTDPQKYLSRTFERISARLDQAPMEEQSQTTMTIARLTIADFFAAAGENLT